MSLSAAATTLGALCSVITKGTTPTTLGRPFTEEGITFVKAESIDGDGRFIPQKFARIDRETHGLLSRSILQEGDILFSIAGVIGRTAIVTRSLLPANTNQAIAILRPASPDVDKVWLYYYLRSSPFQDFSLGHVVQTAQANVSLGVLKSAAVRLPPIRTQQRVAAVLSAYDDLIENNTRRIALLEELARRIYEEWFVRFRFPGHEDVRMVDSELGLVPDSWRSGRLAAFGDVITGKTPSKANPDFYGTLVPFLKTPDMHGNLFILATGEALSREGAASQRNKTVPAGSLCVSCIGTIGVVSITTEPCQTNQQINSLVPADAATLEFLYFRLKDSKKALENLGANGATMGNVNKSKFEELSVLTPARDLLKVFHAAVAPMFGLIQALSRKNVNLRTTRDLLLPKLISGELDVSTMPEPGAIGT